MTRPEALLFPHPGPVRRRRLAAVLAVATCLGASGAAGQEETVHRNRLASESSPYLLQHAGNPVDWHPWGDEAFALARQQGKPVFLSVGYSTCHWCHVMEEQSFEDEEVAEVLNRYFIAIKVDREERPDVDDLYMGAVQMMTGHGGWPMSVWLTPDRKPFYGGTYYPKAQFLQVLGRIAALWGDDREALLSQAERVSEVLVERLGASAAAATLSAEILDRVVGDLSSRFDASLGGFGAAPKFPNETNLLLLLGRYERTGERTALEMVTTSLTAMSRGGIYDHLGGGFHRYSVDARWAVPHFEKMLYNQAWLGRALLGAYRLTGDGAYRTALEETLEYVRRDLTSPQGAFYTAEDADSEGEEGTFYVWTPAQVAAVLTDPADAELFTAYYGITEDGNFEGGATVLHVASDPAAFAGGRGMTPEQLAARLAPLRARMREARGRRERPLRDDKVIAGWNGMMIGTYARAGGELGVPAYVQAAERAADFLDANLRDGDGRLLRTWRDGQAKIPAFLDDHAYVIDGLLEIYRATGDPARLQRARDLADAMLERFWDAGAGGFFSSGAGHDELLVRSKDSYDGAVPSGNAVAVHDLARLARYTGQGLYRERAEATLASFAADVERAPAAFTYLLLAADVLRHGEAGPRADDPRGVLSAVLEPGAAEVSAGAAVDVQVRLSIRPGWHINARQPGAGELIPTDLRAGGPGLPLELTGAAYPEGRKVRLPFSEAPISIYDGEVTIPARLVLGAAAAGPHVARLELSYQACDDEKCYAPETLRLEMALRVAPPAGKPAAGGG